MYSSSVLVLALAVFGASAQSFSSCGLLGGSGVSGGLLGGSGVSGGLLGGSGVSGGLLGGSGVSGGLLGGSGVSGGLLGGVSGVVGGVSNIGSASTPVIETAPLRLPSIIHPANVQETCNCYKTVVRPTLRKEVFTIPSVQRFFQTTSTPVVETVPYVSGSSVDVANTAGVESGLIGNGLSGLNSGMISGVNSGILSGVNSGILSGANSGLVSGGIVGVGSGLLPTTAVVSGVNSGCGGLNGVSGINSGLVSTGIVSGINSGFGSSC